MDSGHNYSLEHDLCSTEWILNKVRQSDSYAQNLYAALCNMQFIKLEIVPILNDDYWSCSWRYAGGIIANMQETGDYINWYCSGMGGFATDDDFDNDKYMSKKKYVPEGTVTDEVRVDLRKLGWVAKEWPDE